MSYCHNYPSVFNLITIVKPSEEPGWLQAKLNDRTGLVPKNYIQLFS